MRQRSESTVPGLLLLYHRPLTADASTIMEHVEAFERHSGFKIWKVNTGFGFPPSLRDIRFQGIILHYSILASPINLNDEFVSYLEANRDCYRVAFFQDEHHYCRQRFEFLNHHRIDCVYTLVEPDYFKDVYQKYTKVPTLVSHIPGYVSDSLILIARRKLLPDDSRTIDIGYRARPLPFYMGRGAQEKTGIAITFYERARNLPLRLDIATTERSRIYGQAWYDFTSRSRAFLGVEAGVSIFDVEDVVRTESQRILAANPTTTFEQLSRQLLNSWEDNIYYRTISPRHFEAAAFRVCQILYEGRYSGVMKPMVHYIPLKKDFSNFDECIRLFQDKTVRQEITRNAYADLIASGRYSYQKFIAGFDQVLREAGVVPQPNSTRPETAMIRMSRELRRLELRARKNHFMYNDFPGRRPLAAVGGPLLRAWRKLRRQIASEQ
jgi:hypothetical protein